VWHRAGGPSSGWGRMGVRESTGYRGLRVYEIGEITGALKQLAKAENICVVLLVQANRAVEAKDRRDSVLAWRTCATAATSTRTPTWLDALKNAMADQKAPSAAKITAAIAVLDRGWGKPQQTVSANVSVFDQMTDDEQKTMLAALEALKGV
jgi:hypothetical protein